MDWQTLENKICSFDLESDEHGKIFAVGAIFRQQSFQRKAPFDIQQVLKDLDQFAQEADYLLGHNIIEHDIPLCLALNSELTLFNKPAIDSLFLSPLAFPENPYHRLVKNYKLLRDSLSDPLADAKLALSLFQDQYTALQEQQAESALLSFYYYAFSDNKKFLGLQLCLLEMGAEAIQAGAAFNLFKSLSKDRVCNTAFSKVILAYLPDPSIRPTLAYCLAWLRVAGGNSVLPPWVRQQFEHVVPVLRQLRDTACQSAHCHYCQTMHSPVTQLERYFGFPAFRALPENAQGDSLQQSIVQAAMRDSSLFAVLPTGGGKSLCFQLPALVRYQRRGALTIVISPLQALMKDQVDNLRSKTGATSAAALYGMLTGPERGAVIKAVQMGDIALLYVSPEQLRNIGFRKAIEQREIACWVFDEAHCLSKWGHDFRPDYLYVARFIKEFAAQQKAVMPAIQCFTATAKQDVKQEIIDYFKANLAQELIVFEGGVERNNLQFEVQTVNSVDKYARINTLLHERLGVKESGSAIVYCAKRTQTEEIAEFLNNQDWQASAFHAGKAVAEKKQIQESFISGDTRVITATNAFGMGIDKEDVRLVIHADIPGSLENYLQEAGRAGRDQLQADCILLFDENDIDTQFKLSASSQIDKRDITQILRGLRRTRKNKQDDDSIVVTTGELLQNDAVETSFAAGDYNADTKVITAISWLERAGFIERNENNTQVFQGRPLVKDRQEAETKIAQLNLSSRQQKRWLAILDTLFNAQVDEGFSADELALLAEFSEPELANKQLATASQLVIRTLFDMSQAGIIQKSLLLTAFVRYKTINASDKLLATICLLEDALVKILQEQAPDADTEEWQVLSLRHINQHLLDSGHSECSPSVLQLLLLSISKDGQGLAGHKGSFFLRHNGLDQYRVKLNRSWRDLEKTVDLRQKVAKIVLDTILAKIPTETKGGVDILVDFAIEDLLDAVKQDIEMYSALKDPLAAVERGLTFLHEQKIISLQKGLAVFRSAMTIQVLPEARRRRYTKGDYAPLSLHYGERTFQVHVMNEYALKGLEKIGHALNFVVAYFELDKSDFVQQYFKGRKEILQRATSQQSFQKIVSDLHNPEQQALVASHEDDNLLILAGPGSGKTRVVIHRCAYLLRVKQVPARSILVLCFNRNAATELRQRLFDLVGPDAKAVTIQTYHGLSLRLSGHALNGMGGNDSGLEFEAMLQAAIDLLTGKQSNLQLDSDEMREQLLAGYRYILVDEYQDIDDLQYQLISALAGRTLDEDSRLSLLAVGDDDQNIYQFRGASTRFIHQFEKDYQATQHFLVENYRSSAHIIAASNQLIASNSERMKQQQPIRINKGRKNLAAGGRWEKLDPLAKGRVQLLRSQNASQQAHSLVQELQRLKQLDNSLDWSHCAILSTEWRLLNPIRALLENAEIPLSLVLPKESQPPVFRIRENLNLLKAIKNSPEKLSTASTWITYLQQSISGKPNIWQQHLQSLLQQWQIETNNVETSKQQFLEYLYEALAEQRRESRLGSGVYLSTIHSVKGMEFSHVFILDGGWRTPASEEQRRLFYVAMTRAKETLCLMQAEHSANPYLQSLAGDFILARKAEVQPEEAAISQQEYLILGLHDLDLSYAASISAVPSIHQVLADLTVGDQVSLKQVQTKILVQKGGISIAVLSKTAQQVWQAKLTKIQSATVIAMITRYKTDNKEAYQARCKVDQWEVPMLELLLKA
ncbi:MAG: RecQ family ATP-dependent DNA helicase [Methyloprofundus sp.]|nr:RecQ family ATP-dependent DNA helicase [Methyloprofundus sp.]